MKFTCYRNDLLEALQVAIRSVAVKPMTPILAGVYMRADNNSLELQANNFNTAVIIKIPVSIEQTGEIVLIGKKFLDFVRNLREETLTLSGNDTGTFSIESGGARVELLAMPANEFPKVKTPDTDNSFTVRSTALRNLIRKTLFAVAKDDDRPIFKGCLFEVAGDSLSLVATNAHRIAVDKEFIRNNDSNENLVVPAEALRGLMQYLDPDDTDNHVEVKYSRSVVTFRFDNVYMTARVIEGDFPPYGKIIPTESVTRAEVSKQALREAIDLAAILARDSEYKMVTFSISPNQIIISSNSPDVGGASQVIAADVSGDNLDISFNVEYIIDALRTLDTDRIQLSFNGKYDPILIREPGNENYSYVVTPVRA